ncbi:hypothetical protein ANCDUO_25194, partial [Ancylostoma duodenale]
MKHVGLVVTDTQPAEAVVRNYVLEFKVNKKNECTQALAQVGHAAFRFEPNGAFDQVYVKNQKRRLERPLSFGDVIEWDDADVTNKLISRIRRVLVTGVVSPSDKFLFWSQYFPRIEIDSVSSNDVLPNVSVSAWLNITVDANRRLCIEFDSSEKVECETSIVAAAPWNRNGCKYPTLTIPINDDGLESQIEEPEVSSYDGGWKQELHSYEGICTGGRLIYCKKLPHHSIVAALIKNTKDSVPLETAPFGRDVQQTSRPSPTPFVVVWIGDREPPQSDSQVAKEDAEVSERPQSVLEAISAINPENAMEAAMGQMRINETKPHTVECTEEICAPKCPHMEMIMLMIET